MSHGISTSVPAHGIGGGRTLSKIDIHERVENESESECEILNCVKDLTTPEVLTDFYDCKITSFAAAKQQQNGKPFSCNRY